MYKTRRSFLTQLSTATSLSLVSSALANPNTPLNNKQPYRVAIIGSTDRGNYGHRLDIAWRDVEQAQIIAVADDHPAGLAEAGQRLKVDRLFNDYRMMIDQLKPDIVVVCPRWIDQHSAMALHAINRGAHVYMEKPLCRTLAEADAMVEACAANDVKLAVAHPTRYSPTLHRVRQLIQEGAIGQVLELRGRGKEDKRGGGEDLWVLGAHVMDMIVALGYNPDWCFASVLQNGQEITAADVKQGAEGIGLLGGDAVRAMYGLNGGITANFHSYRQAEGKPTRYALQIFGSKGVIEILEGTLPDAFILQDPSWSPGRSGKTWKRITSAGIDQPEPLTAKKYSERHRLAIDDFLASIQQDRQPLCSATEARKTIEMIAAVFESQRTGGRVKFPLKTRVNPLSLMK